MVKACKWLLVVVDKIMTRHSTTQCSLHSNSLFDVRRTRWFKHKRVCGKVFLLFIGFCFLRWIFNEALPDDHKPLQIRWQVVECRRLEGRHACRGWAAVVFAQGLHLNRSTWNTAKKKHKHENSKYCMKIRFYFARYMDFDIHTIEKNRKVKCVDNIIEMIDVIRHRQQHHRQLRTLVDRLDRLLCTSWGRSRSWDRNLARFRWERAPLRKRYCRRKIWFWV